MSRGKTDFRELRKAIAALQKETPKAKGKCVQQAARGFVKKIVEITPPASEGVTGNAARQRGEQIIVSDIGRIMTGAVAQGTTRRTLLDGRSGAASAEELYKRFRDSRTGRINPAGLRHPYLVPQAQVMALLRRLLGEVGWMAAGWNAAARSLKVGLPAWIRRHGDRAGSILVRTRGEIVRIEVTNKVKFVGNVKDYNRRIQKAVDYQAGAMRRQAQYLMEKAVKKSGF